MRRFFRENEDIIMIVVINIVAVALFLCAWYVIVESLPEVVQIILDIGG